MEITRVGPAGAPSRTAEGKTEKACAEERQKTIAKPGISSQSKGVSQEWREVKGGLGLSAVAATVLRKNHRVTRFSQEVVVF